MIYLKRAICLSLAFGITFISINTKPALAGSVTFAYPATTYSFKKDQKISNLQPTVSGGAINIYTIPSNAPVQLPKGLILNNKTGVISGKPTEIYRKTSVKIIGASTSGTTSTSITIEVIRK